MTNTQQDVYIRRLLQQAEIEPLQIPLIHPSTAAEPQGKRSARRSKSKSAVARFFKKFIYFKPKTFWGTQILIPILSTTIGIWVTAIVKQPKSHHPPRDKGRIEQQQPQTNAVISSAQIVHSLDLLSQLYQSWTTNTSDALVKEKTLVCPTCNHAIQVTASSFLQPVISCVTCQQAYQAPEAESAKERE